MLRIPSLLLTCLLLSACSSRPRSEKISPHLQSMFPADLQFEGEYRDLYNLSERPTLLIFGASNNQYCHGLAERLRRIQIQYENRVGMVYISFDDNAQQAQDFIHRYKLNTAWLAPKSTTAIRLSKEHAITSHPSIVVIGSNGKIITRNGLKELLDNWPDLPGGWR